MNYTNFIVVMKMRLLKKQQQKPKKKPYCNSKSLPASLTVLVNVRNMQEAPPLTQVRRLSLLIANAK